MQRAIDEIRASILAHRGSLDGLLDEFLAERREEARREAHGFDFADNRPEALHDE